ncbi:MAG: MBL fold metallo-hydrolase [Synechococcaceae cyanobacterium]|nr:MBL fold metallo-hydrolase [Synechococcaceae cyanobacterium]
MEPAPIAAQESPTATYLGANGWLLSFSGGPRVLVDPWLTGPLQFGPGDWLLKGELADPQAVPEAVDLLLLTQGLSDHCHPPSLALLPRSIPVVASTSAAQRVRALGFETVTALRPGERHSHGALTVTATAGAPVPQVENGYLLEHPSASLYLEPHGFLSPDLPPQQLTAVITPVIDVGLPLAGAFVRGRTVLPQLLERFHPATVLASTTGGDVAFSGLLAGLLQVQGTPAEAARSAPCRFIDPVPGQAYGLRAE